MNSTTQGAALASGPEYDSQIAHTIWELECSVREGRTGEATRRVLLQAHTSQLQLVEERAGVPPEGRSFVLLQPRVAPGLLMLPGEGTACEGLGVIARQFHRAGFSVLACSLAYRKLDTPGHSPIFWQTCADEALNRFDMLSHYASGVVVLGVGLSATIALHLAASEKIGGVIALFPKLHASIAWRERLKMALRRLVPRTKHTPPAWSVQRRMATDSARHKAEKLSTPLFVVAQQDVPSGEDADSIRFAQRLLAGRAAEVRWVPSGHAAPQLLPEAVIDDLVQYVRPRPARPVNRRSR